MSSTSSLVGRAALAVVLMLGFYCLAIAIVGGLIYIPYAEWTYGRRLHLKLALFCVVGAAIILKAILPTPDRFVPPGPLLAPHAHPKLFEILAAIARATRQEMPAEVYLISEMNAWVMQRGGRLGVGSRRVMGLGLPLLQVLHVSQLRAVLAHEFGHFYGGDTKLGPWMYRTRAALGRTLEGLAEHGALIQKPFLWYGMAFLRLTHGMSRRQEFAADALAARIVGARPLIEGLKLIHGTALACNAYWNDEVVPVLRQGFRPPIAEGLRHYFASSRIAEVISKELDYELAEGEANPYDTHPPLPERVAALQNPPEGAIPEDDPPAISLLENVEECEMQLISALTNTAAAQLQSVAWDEVGRKVWLPVWEDYTKKRRRVLVGITPYTLPEVVQDLDTYSRRLEVYDARDLTPEERYQQIATLLGTALAVALYRDGWELLTLPGDDVACERQGTVLKPFDIIPHLIAGAITPAAWQKFCVTAGIAELALDGTASATQESTAEQRADNATAVCPACGHAWIGYWDGSLKDRQCPQCRERWRSA
jgi:Zn-dependent protease with chaperone function